MSSSSVVVAESGAVGVTRDDDNLDNHFRDTVAGGEWLYDQDGVDYFVAHCTEEVAQLEHWHCPWSRKADGSINIRFFGVTDQAKLSSENHQYGSVSQWLKC